jgi:hypothetical protein
LSKASSEVIDDRFLSHDVTTLCIDDSKKSLNRILLVMRRIKSNLKGARHQLIFFNQYLKKLCESNFQPKAVDEIYDILCFYLCKEHFYYAIDLHINALQSIDTKQEVNLYIFSLVKQQNDLMYLFEQFSNSTVFPAVK